MSNLNIDHKFEITLNVEEIIYGDNDVMNELTLEYKDMFIEKLMPLIDYFQVSVEDFYNESVCTHKQHPHNFGTMELKSSFVDDWFNQVCRILFDLIYIKDDLYDLSRLPEEFKSYVNKYEVELEIQSMCLWIFRLTLKDLVRSNQSDVIVDLIEEYDPPITLK